MRLPRHWTALSGIGLLALACFVPSTAALAEKRVALVIGNSKYTHTAPLQNPKNDADDVAAALKRSGFETIVGFDLDRSGMDDASARFARAARDADVTLFYYAGHAMQYSGVNYLLPVDAQLKDEFDLRRMTRVDDIVADLQQAKKLRILVLDSCRDNPLAEDLKRVMGRTRGATLHRGLAKIDSALGMIVAYATQSGRTAEDGSSRNSPFTTAFLKHIETPGEIGTVFRRISADVYEATRHEQLPELSLSLIGEFYLRGRPASAVAPATVAALPPPEKNDPSDIARLLQAELRRIGCHRGTIDAEWNTNARQSLELFNKHAGMRLDVKAASLDALDAVRSKRSSICPLLCERGFRAEGERCVAIEREPGNKSATRTGDVGHRDATAESMSISGAGAIATGQTKVLTARDGRKMTCIGGSIAQRIPRRCTWQ